MKKLFTLLMLIPFAMICSCQKQDSAAEQQLAQRKAELEAREKAEAEREKALKALVEREKALAEREKATLAEREKAIASAHTISPDVQSRGQVTDPAQMKALLGQKVTDPAQMKAQKEKIIQQLPPEVQALIPDPTKVKAEREARMQKRLAGRQSMLEEFQRKGIEAKKEDARVHAEQLDAAKAKKNVMRAMPAVTAAPAAGSLGSEATSPTQLAPLSVYPQPEATSPSPSPSPTPQ